MSDRFHHLFIRTEDFAASLAFYRDVLGWDVMEEWGADGEDRGAILSGGGVKVVIAATGEDQRDGDSKSGAPNLHLDIHDIDTRFSKLPKGTHVVREPEDTHWGTRWFVVRDPDGNLIAFEEIHGGRASR